MHVWDMGLCQQCGFNAGRLCVEGEVSKCKEGICIRPFSAHEVAALQHFFKIIAVEGKIKGLNFKQRNVTSHIH